MELPKIEGAYKDAREIYAQLNGAEISEKDFYELIRYFRENYLHHTQWRERAAKHRNPGALHDEVWRQSGRYTQVIEGRTEMQAVWEKEGMVTHGSVPGRLKLIREEDKTLRSLFEIVQYYCEITGKEFAFIAVHIAEYRGVCKVCDLIRTKLHQLTRLQSQGTVKKRPVFIESIIDGVRELQHQDISADCMARARKGEYSEATFRNWFKTFLAGRHLKAKLSAEEEKGTGRIDLKVTHPDFGTQIIEFKGWWNRDKKNLADQLCSYLTDFEQQGYVFMINPLKQKDIAEQYKQLLTAPEMGYIENSWQEHKVEGADFSFYESRHQFGIKEKTIYHFIFNVYFSHQRRRKKEGNGSKELMKD